MKKIFVIGARSFLASYLIQTAPSNIILFGGARSKKNLENIIHYQEIDIASKSSVNKAFANIKPDITINCAAISLPDYAEDHKEETYCVNVIGVANIAEACKKYNSKLIHLSTDYVFDGEKGNYNEEDKTNPINYYGNTKVEAEKVLYKYFNDIKILICRTAVLYGIPKSYQRPELMMGMINKLKSKQILKVTNQIASATFVKDLALVIWKLVQSNFDESDIIHTAGPQGLSRFQFARKIAEIFEFDYNLIKKVESIPKRAKRPKNTSLNVEKLYNKYGIKTQGLDAALNQIKDEINLN